eukprot:CAMPEP_0197047432 /NCGR_PEP_ID=MMETSP1384-20130603/22943_1 /TAXON_ID=29189 /ORGANISM="Ammonia sp." /LENGTH=1300 /DNA_ID=CAMNT_0042479351 /DNA_START=77 /DNA_END=3979 /DNA_ORIENTATION=-
MNDQDFALAMQLQQEFDSGGAQGFTQTYTPQNATHSLSTERQKQLELARNIILPQFALSIFTANNYEWPIMLKLTNPDHGHKVSTHVGIQEYSDQDGIAILPASIMQHLQCTDFVQCQYVKLAAAKKLLFQPHSPLFVQHPSHMMHLRNSLATLSCLTVNDTISVEIGDQRYSLDVQSVEPSNEHNAVSLQNCHYRVDIAFVQAALNEAEKGQNEQQEPQEKRPIVSSIKSTKGGPAAKQNPAASQSTKGNDGDNDNDDNEDLLDPDNNTFGGGEAGDDEEEGDEEAAFSDNADADAWGDDADGYDSLIEDGQVYLDIPREKRGKVKELTPGPYASDDEELVPDPNSTAGNDAINRPSMIKNVEHRAWICEFCHSINNLLDSMKRNYQCNCCNGRYRPGQKLIESAEQDAPLPEMYTVWCCVCSAENDINWTSCVLCGEKKPSEGLFTFKTTEKPKFSDKLNNDNNAGGVDYSLAGNARQQGGDQWCCSKCFAHNTTARSTCKVCDTSRWGGKQHGDRHKDEDGQKYRHDYHSSVTHMGTRKNHTQYPVFGSAKILMNMRLVRVFGATYRNSCIASTAQNEWNAQISLHHGLVPVQCTHALQREVMYLKSFGTRSVAIHAETGWVAMIGQGKLTQFIVVFEPKGAGSFVVHTIYEMPKAEQIGSAWFDAEMCRIRFVGENIYVFNYAKFTVLQFYFDRESHALQLNSQIYDSYFSQAQVKDVLITKDVLIILFDRWLGVYKLYPRLEWYHAVAYSKADNLSVRSFEMVSEDDWEDRVPMEQEAFFRNDDNDDDADDEQDEEKLDEEEEDQEEEKKQEEAEKIMAVETYKPSIKSFVHINCENSIISIHPANPTFDFMHIASNVKLGSSFCISRKYGTFWINNEKDRIMQSSKYDAYSTTTVCEIDSDKFEWKNFRMIPMTDTDLSTLGNEDDEDAKKPELDLKNIKSFETVLYDESYGVSGRLLVRCQVSIGKDVSVPVFYQLFNHAEFEPLKQEFARQDYFLMPGTDRKPFNLYVYVYEMLFGSDLMDSLVQAPDFNLVYAVPGDNKEDAANEQEEEQENKDEEDEQNAEKPFHANQLLQVESKCLVFVEDKWLNGVVTKELETDKFEILVDDYNAPKTGITLELQRYDEDLKYNGIIPFNVQSVGAKESWNVGDRLFYYHEVDAVWNPGKVVKVWKDAKGKWLRVEVNNMQEQSYVANVDVDYEKEAENLRKEADVVEHDNDDEQKLAVHEQVEHDGPQEDGEKIAMMQLPGEGPLDQSYVAVQPIGNVQAEKSEDVEEGVLVDVNEVDMELEEEGAN